MAAYIPVILWVVSAIVCSYIAKVRNIKSNFMKRLIVLFLGPLAIPLVFFSKPDISTED